MNESQVRAWIEAWMIENGSKNIFEAIGQNEDVIKFFSGMPNDEFWEIADSIDPEEANREVVWDPSRPIQFRK